MNYPFAEVKARVALEELMRDDRVKLMPAGSRLKCLSPFNPEKHASCYVDPRAGRFMCFSSGNKGDIFDYLMLTTNCSKEHAMEVLLERAGLSGDGPRPAPLPRRLPRPASREEKKPLVPLAGDDLLAWREGVTTLLGNPELQHSIADWRKFRLATVIAMARAGLMGCVKLNPWLRKQEGVMSTSQRRVAFAVQAPVASCPPEMASGEPGQQVVRASQTVAYHIRLKPKYQGDKPGWRYMPFGLGAWPFVLGDVRACRLLLICEGQWDAMALFDALGFADVAQLPSAGVAIVGTRGAASWELFTQHWLLAGYSADAIAAAMTEDRRPDAGGRMRRVKTSLRPELKVVLICDGDKAGHLWTTRMDEEKPSFAEVLEVVAGEVVPIEPLEAPEGGVGKDFNDVLRVLRTAAD